jgi:hypothetical protein
LLTDEEHYDAYRADFDDLFATARFSQPTSGVAPLPGGFWMQRDYSFALWLPAGFQPAFAARGKVLLSASRPADKDSGPAELVVVGATGPPQDLEALKDMLPGEIIELDPDARVARCQFVPQGKSRALETVVHTDRVDQKVTIISRRFRGHTRNYELRATLPSEQFEQYEPRWQRAAESFREVIVQEPGGLL